LFFSIFISNLKSNRFQIFQDILSSIHLNSIQSKNLEVSVTVAVKGEKKEKKTVFFFF